MRYSLPSVAQQVDTQSPQPSIVTQAPIPAPIERSPTADPTTAAQPSSVAQPPTITQLTASTSGPPSQRLRFTGHSVMHVNDLDGDYLPLANIDDD
eukprot:4692271-Pleurochrysis_carterae.AAC.1